MVNLNNSFVQNIDRRFNSAMEKLNSQHHIPPTWAVCLIGALGLAVAMGIGRFAFTPLLPLMRHEGLIDAGGGAWLAAANYLGYLLGALSAAWLPGSPRIQVLGSLLLTAVLTTSIAVVPSLAGWMALRLAAGMASAWTLVAISSWTVSTLAQRQRSDASGWVFAGVGLGIAVAGGLTWWHAEAGASALWRELGWLALGLAAVAGLLWRKADSAVPARPAHAAAPAHAAIALPGHSTALVLCYGTLGFGYILPATYLPALAQELMHDPDRFGLVWPVFGTAAACSTLLAGYALRRWHGRRIWAASHAAMAAGCALPLFSHSGWAVTMAALLVGGTFMVATMTGLQQARNCAPANPKPLLGRMTAAFALGQIAGPLLVLVLRHLPPAPFGLTSITLAQSFAVVALLGSAHWLYRSLHHLEK